MDINKYVENLPPIIEATKQGDIDEVRQMLDDGTGKVTDTDLVNNTALHVAAGWDRKDIAQLLLEYGADINHKGFYGRTPIFNAADDSNFELIKLFIDCGADLNIIELERGYKLIEYCKRRLKKDKEKIIKYIVENL